jgi:predicted double-glycine peptidase
LNESPSERGFLPDPQGEQNAEKPGHWSGFFSSILSVWSFDAGPVDIMPKSALLCLVAIATAITSAFADGGGRKPVRSLLEIREDRVIVQKWETSCAAAALATVLTFSHNDVVSEKTVTMGMLRTTDPIKVKVRGGFSMLDMKHFVETRGLKGIGYKNLSFDDLLALEAPIVPIDFQGNPHFVVVRGLNGDGEVHLADPAFGNHAIAAEKFKSVWKDGMAFVVTE